MGAVQAVRYEPRTETNLDFDAIVIGAGVSGLYQLYRLRELGMTARVFEAGTAVGGTGEAGLGVIVGGTVIVCGVTLNASTAITPSNG